MAVKKAVEYAIKNYTVQAEIGCADDEFGIKQEVVINMNIHVVATDDLFKDSKQMPYDYMIALETIDRTIKRQHWLLQEALANEIGTQVLDHPRVQKVEITTMKTQRYEGTEGIGVTLVIEKLPHD